MIMTSLLPVPWPYAFFTICPRDHGKDWLSPLATKALPNRLTAHETRHIARFPSSEAPISPTCPSFTQRGRLHAPAQTHRDGFLHTLRMARSLSRLITTTKRNNHHLHTYALCRKPGPYCAPIWPVQSAATRTHLHHHRQYNTYTMHSSHVRIDFLNTNCAPARLQ